MLQSLMNNTKWDELRLAMYGLDKSPVFYVLSTEGHRYGPDREWFYHFGNGGYRDILEVDIHADDLAHRERIRDALMAIHLPGRYEATP